MKCQLCSYNDADFCYGCTKDKSQQEKKKAVQSFKDFIDREINSLEAAQKEAGREVKPSFTATLAELEKVRKWIEIKYERRE